MRSHLDSACALSAIRSPWHPLLLVGKQPNARGFITQKMTDVGAVADDSPQQDAPEITTMDL